MLATILIYIYPLRAVFGSMWFFLSDGRVGQALGTRTDAQARALFATFAVGFTAVALEIVLLNVRAWQLREPLRLNERERLMTRDDIAGWSLPAGVGIISLVLALILPMRELAWSGWVYFSMAILVPLHSAYRKRRMKDEAQKAPRKLRSRN
jgi:hypothetical protein